MRHVPIAELEGRASEIVAAAESGEEIIITRSGRDVAKLVAIRVNRSVLQRAAADAAYALGQEIKAKYGPTTAEEIREWREEGRR